MNHEDTTRSTPARGSVRTLRQQEELPLLRDHLLRLDRASRHDRFHGFMDDDFIERYAAKCADDGTAIVAYIEDGVVRVFATAPAEAPTTRGFASVLVHGLDGLPVEDALAVPDDYPQTLGLGDAVSPLRLRGMTGLLARIKRQLRAAV